MHYKKVNKRKRKSRIKYSWNLGKIYYDKQTYSRMVRNKDYSMI